MEKLPRRMAWARISYAIFAFIVSCIVTYLFWSDFHNKSEVIGILTSVFSILARVLIAIVSILGDPGMLMDQSWRSNYIRSGEIQRKLHRKIDIFLLYILILFCAFIFLMIENQDSQLYKIFQIIVLFLSVLGFIFSFLLPYSLIEIQRERLNRAIQSMIEKECSK